MSDGTLAVNGGTLDYRACAGLLSIEGEAGKLLGTLFYTAYLAPSADGDPRPLSIVWNGGPGADSRLLHFHAIGPRKLEEGELVSNPASVLPASDLVFLDPAGTGFSRAASDEAAEQLYSTTGDLAATVAFVRKFRRAYRRETSPLYLVGESFGTWRAAGAAEALIDQGIPVDGIALVSGGIPLGDLPDRALSRALSLPNRVAVALAFGRLDEAWQADPEATLAEAERWARGTWYPALKDPAAVPAETRADIAARLAAWHGLAVEQVDPETLWVSPRDFRTGLLAEGGETLDVFDMRKTGGAAAADDPGDTAILSYYRDSLGYNAGFYAGIESEELPVGQSWQYDQAPITEESLARALAGEGPPSPSQPWTLRAMRKAPDLRTWVAAGIYDSLNSCAANRAVVADLPDDISRRISLNCYKGGHMMYESDGVAAQFAADLSAFLQED
ncbi:peptidase S10 [Pacificimonas flava]|uniref:Peptidase S10 n=3 Tax=Sphingosinicellaceae TaxID=2820280 RepID=A0A219B8B1_9SPHN|nr:peptidase S10 [Pacificimonas aurantium]OWV34630.1 peptidase S10 [Pacificimonas flava]